MLGRFVNRRIWNIVGVVRMIGMMEMRGVSRAPVGIQGGRTAVRPIWIDGDAVYLGGRHEWRPWLVGAVREPPAMESWGQAAGACPAGTCAGRRMQ